ncbi:MAG: winged helix DNA-binding protein [Azospirillaceae bacterium]
MTAASRRSAPAAAEPEGAPDGAPEPAPEGEDDVALDRLIEVLETFRALDPDMPIQYALSFLTLARHEGLSMRELSDRLGIAQSSASRNVAALSEWQSFRRPGHDLVRAEEDPRERRRKIVRLTAKGRALADRLAALIAGRPAVRLTDAGPAREKRSAAPATGHPATAPRRRKA